MPALASALLLAAACGGSGGKSSAPVLQSPSRAATTTTPPPSPPNGPPRGLIALGHSGVTGYASDPANLGADAPENSWVTGTNPAVDSIYLRLAKAAPASYRGYVANYGVDGSTVDSLRVQAAGALEEVPKPLAVVVQSIDNDIRCDGTDKRNYGPFGRTLAGAMRVITTASPKVTILLLPQIGRPLTFAEASQKVPEARLHQSSDQPCSLLTPNGKLNLPEIHRLTTIVEGYEAVERQVCAALKQCVYLPAFASYKDTPAGLAKHNWDHLSIAGHAALAELMWPSVKRALHIR